MRSFERLQPNFSGGALTTELHSRFDIQRYYSSFKAAKNFFVRREGMVSNRQGLTFIGEVHDSSKITRLIEFSFSDAATDQQYLLEVGDGDVRFIKSDGIVQSGGSDYILTVPYADDDVFGIRFAQSADEVYLSHTGYQPGKITRLADDNWTFGTITIGTTITTPSISSGSYSGGTPDGVTTERYKVTAVNENGEESQASALRQVTRNSIWEAGEEITLVWGGVSGSVKYNVYKEVAGVYGYIGVAVSTVTFTDRNYTPDASIVPPVVKNPFDGSDWPTAVSFFEERLVFGGKGTAPFEVNASRTALFSNFNTSEPPRDDDAIQVALLGGQGRQVNAIKHLVELNQLLVLTDNVIFRLTGVDDAPLTPNSIDRKARSYIGVGEVPPIATEDSVLVVDRTGKRVYDVRPGNSLQTAAVDDLTVMVRDLFEDRRIVDWAYAEDPFDIIWCVMSDGGLLGLTYVRDQDIWAWHEHSTPNGAFESVAVLEVDGESVPYFIVRRTINGQVKRYIEALKPRQDRDIVDAFYVDSGLTYDGSPQTTFTGLGHLEGETVSILADGFVVTPQVVSGGSVTLPFAASKVHVGLLPDYEFETLNIAVDPQGGTVRARFKQINNADIQLYRSAGTKIGPNKEQAGDVRMRTNEALDAPVALFTGIKTVDLFTDLSTEAHIFVSHPSPTPISIAAIGPDLKYGV